MAIIKTERLILRSWKSEDANAYFQINQDPKVIEFLSGPFDMEYIIDFISRMNKQEIEHGYTLWAVELKATGECIGFIGLSYVDWPTSFAPAVEVGWRLGSQFWGKGYATEGAKAALDYGFNTLGLKEIVSFTVPENKASIRVMEKISMKRDLKGDFAHPKLEPDHPLSKCILYRIAREDK